MAEKGTVGLLTRPIRSAGSRTTKAKARSDASRLAIMSAAPTPLPETSPIAIPSLASESSRKS